MGVVALGSTKREECKMDEVKKKGVKEKKKGRY